MGRRQCAADALGPAFLAVMPTGAGSAGPTGARALQDPGGAVLAGNAGAQRARNHVGEHRRGLGGAAAIEPLPT